MPKQVSNLTLGGLAKNRLFIGGSDTLYVCDIPQSPRRPDAMIQRFSRIGMVCADPERLADFYETAFGFARIGEVSTDDAALAELSGRRRVRAKELKLRLGEQNVSLMAIEPAGRIYPAGIPRWSPLFQRIAIVVADMNRVFARLSSIAGRTGISTAGPQLLPLSSGGVTAFKFRDPEGHPLELIAFPEGTGPDQWQKELNENCRGIDHSAISVSHSARSIAFYEALGLHRSGGSENCGPEQSKLDDVPDAVVEVTALSLP